MCRHIFGWFGIVLLSSAFASCGDQVANIELDGSGPTDVCSGSHCADLGHGDAVSDGLTRVDSGDVENTDVSGDACAGLDCADLVESDAGGDACVGAECDLDVSTDGEDAGTGEYDSGSDGSEEVSNDAALDGGDASDVCSDPDCSDTPECGEYCEPFSVVLLPDTQYYTSKQADNANNAYYGQTQWIVENRDALGIQFVMHLGDITNNNTVAQWTIADKAHDILDDAGVPYSVVPGNHDYLSTGQFSRGDTLYGDYFGPERFTDQPWYGGSLDGRNLNNYNFFEVGPYQFMVVGLEYAPRKETLCWADDLIAAHPEHRVIVVTHCYISHGGAYGSDCPNSSYDVPGADGATVWDELVSRHSNIFLVVSGHIGDSEYVPAEGNSGNTVHQMLVDYQFEVPCSAATPTGCNDHCHSSGYTGNGWLRLLTFDPAQNRVSASTYSVESGNEAVFPGGVPTFFCSLLNTHGEVDYAQDPSAPDHNFSFDYALTAPVVYERDDLDSRRFDDLTVNTAGSGDQIEPQVVMSSDGAFVAAWEDNSDSSDGAGNHDIFLRGFVPSGCGSFSDRMAHGDGGGQQQTPALAADASGAFVVVWADDSDGNGLFQIRARGFWADGSERFSERTVNSVATGQQLNPDVAASPDGRFAVVWEDDVDQDGNYQIVLRGFEADGSQRFADLTVNEAATGQHRYPALATDGAGRVLVVWQDDTDGNGSYQIRARGLAADGSAWLSSFTVNSVSTGQQLRPTVGMDGSSGFAVAWEDDSDRNNVFRVLVRGFESDGSQRFADMAVSAAAAGQQGRPALSMAADGRIALVWEDDSDDNGSYQIRSRGLTRDGDDWFALRTVNEDPDGQQLAPHLAVHSSGAIVYVWEDDMDGNGYYQIVANGAGP